jgi:hypothetical protein
VAASRQELFIGGWTRASPPGALPGEFHPKGDPRVPHVFQAYHAILDEAAAALDRAGQLLSAHLASAERVTA